MCRTTSPKAKKKIYIQKQCYNCDKVSPEKKMKWSDEWIDKVCQECYDDEEKEKEPWTADLEDHHEDICCKCGTDEDVETCDECDKQFCIECDPNEMATYGEGHSARSMCEPCSKAEEC